MACRLPNTLVPTPAIFDDPVGGGGICTLRFACEVNVDADLVRIIGGGVKAAEPAFRFELVADIVLELFDENPDVEANEGFEVFDLGDKSSE